MSLINEALRRSRHDAERREAARSGHTPPPGQAAGPPVRPLPSIALLAVLGLAIGVGLVGGTALFLRDGASRERPSDGAKPDERFAAAGLEAEGGAALPGTGGDRPRVARTAPSYESTREAMPAAPGNRAGRLASKAAANPTATADRERSRGEPAAPQHRGGGATPPAASGGTAPAAPTRSGRAATGAREDSRRADATGGVTDEVTGSGRAGGPEDPRSPRGRTQTAAPLAAPRVTEDESGVLVVLADEGGGNGASESRDGSGRSFSRRVELAGGETIELGGIAWSETGPFALINGRVVGPGEKVGGFRVIRIEPKQVEIEAGGETIYLRLK